METDPRGGVSGGAQRNRLLLFDGTLLHGVLPSHRQPHTAAGSAAELAAGTAAPHMVVCGTVSFYGCSGTGRGGSLPHHSDARPLGALGTCKCHGRCAPRHCARFALPLRPAGEPVCCGVAHRSLDRERPHAGLFSCRGHQPHHPHVWLDGGHAVHRGLSRARPVSAHAPTHGPPSLPTVLQISPASVPALSMYHARRTFGTAMLRTLRSAPLADRCHSDARPTWYNLCGSSLM
jgi:hypothetical protein